ncbi:MAG: hypothetical protein GH143_00185 [Calditrichaeota bacterium]|nr:hypothetical protein [Calditrichota bacterium]
MAKTNSTHAQTELSNLRGVLDRLLNRFYPRLDWLFLLRPVVFIPVWTTAAAGLGVGHWLSRSDLFWHVAWDWGILLLFIGVTLITGAAFIRVQLQAGGETEIKGYPSVLDEGNLSPAVARRLLWIGLGLGLVLLLPGGWLAVLAGAALFMVWGLLYGTTSFLWKGRPAVEAIIHALAGAALFYLGWAASGAPLEGSLNLAAPYVLAFAGVGALTAITPGPRYPADRPRPGTTAITITLAAATVMAIAATVWGYRNGDPVISTTAVLTLPFYAVALFYRRELDVVRTSRYSILIFVIFVGARYPLLFIPVILDFYLSRYYYRRRLGLVHPAFHAEHD